MDSNGVNNNKRNNQDNQPKMPKFNMNWIYGLILIALITLFLTGGGNILGGSSSQEATYTRFKQYVEKGYASKVVVNKEDSKLQMYVKPENIRDVFQMSAKQVGPDPYVEVELGSVDELEKYLDTEQKVGKLRDFSYDNSKDNDIWSILINLSPIIFFFIFIWWLTRRMGGSNGGAGGPGGVFNVGKSKAPLS